MTNNFDEEPDFLDDEQFLTQGRKIPIIQPDVEEENFTFGKVSEKPVEPQKMDKEIIENPKKLDKVVENITTEDKSRTDVYDVKSAIIKGIVANYDLKIPESTLKVPNLEFVKNMLNNTELMTEEEAVDIIMDGIDIDSVLMHIRENVINKIRNGEYNLSRSSHMSC